MSLPQIVSQDEWTAACTSFLVEEKSFTEQRDRLSSERRELPMVEVTKPYRFEGPGGSVGLRELHRRYRRALAGLHRSPALA